MDDNNNEALNIEMDYSENPADTSEYEEPTFADDDSNESDSDDTYEEESTEDARPQRKVPDAIPYNRFAEVNNKYRESEAEKARIQTELEFYRRQQESVSSYKSPEELQAQQQREAAIKQAKDLGLLTKDDVDTLRQEITKEFEQKEQNKEFENSMAQQAKELERTYSNIPGVPKKINVQELIEFGQKRGTFTQNLDDLMWLKYKKELASNYTAPKARVAPIASSSGGDTGAMPDPNTMPLDQLRQWILNNGNK